jgi:purine-binding chemotaxis protein CheW
MTHARATEAASAATGSSEFLTFRLGGEHYGIPILAVQEIRGYDAPTAIANAPAFIKGVINLRGVIVPVLDLRLRFGLAAPCDATTVVIVLGVAQRVVGVVVDAVCDVVPLAPSAIQPPPEFASTVLETRYLTGLATVDDGLVILLDIENLMTGADMGLVQEQVF